MCPISRFIIAAIFAFIPALAYGVIVYCPGLEITLETENKSDADILCNTIDTGRTVLSALGLELPARLSISFSHDPIVNNLCQSKCIGFYDARYNIIFLPDYKSLQYKSQQASLFINEAVTSIIWESYLIHELAHAAVQSTILPETSMCIACEYIASVAQLEAMPTIERDKILDYYKDLHGFVGNEEITLTYYLIDSARFIVNSYLHYHRPENGPHFIEQILIDGLSCDLL